MEKIVSMKDCIIEMDKIKKILKFKGNFIDSNNFHDIIDDFIELNVNIIQTKVSKQNKIRNKFLNIMDQLFSEFYYEEFTYNYYSYGYLIELFNYITMPTNVYTQNTRFFEKTILPYFLPNILKKLRLIHFFLEYNVQIDTDYSIFSDEVRETKKITEKWFSRAYNIFSSNNFNTENVNGLYIRLNYLADNYNDMIKLLLERSYYEEYKTTFELIKGPDLLVFSQLIYDLKNSTSFAERCMLIKDYLDKYNATFYSFSKSKKEPYRSYMETYKKHTILNRNTNKKTDKYQAFTYIFFKLYNDIGEKEKFDQVMKGFKNDIKNINSTNRLKGENVKKIKNMINELNKNKKQQYYKQKREALIKAQKKYIYSSNKRVALNIENNVVNNSLKEKLFEAQKKIYNEKYNARTKLKINPNTFTKSEKLKEYIKTNKISKGLLQQNGRTGTTYEQTYSTRTPQGKSKKAKTLALRKAKAANKTLTNASNKVLTNVQ